MWHQRRCLLIWEETVRAPESNCWKLGIDKEKNERKQFCIYRLGSCLVPTDFALLPTTSHFSSNSPARFFPSEFLFVLFCICILFSHFLCIWFPSRILLRCFRCFCSVFKLHLLFQSVDFLHPSHRYCCWLVQWFCFSVFSTLARGLPPRAPIWSFIW